MLEEQTVSFTEKEIGEAAQGNLVAVMSVAIRYLQVKGLDINEFWQFIGENFARGWTGIAEGDTPTVAYRIAANMASCGSEIEHFHTTQDKAELVFTNWLPDWAVDLANISPGDAAMMSEVFRPIAASLGYDFDWKLDKGAIRMIIEKN